MTKFSTGKRSHVAACCTLALCAWTAATPSAVWAQAEQRTEAPSPRIERLVQEDAGSRVDELRVGGQTQRIDVQTKSGLPAYQVAPPDAPKGPASPADQRSGSNGSSGRSSWSFFQF